MSAGCGGWCRSDVALSRRFLATSRRRFGLESERTMDLLQTTDFQTLRAWRGLAPSRCVVAKHTGAVTLVEWRDGRRFDAHFASAAEAVVALKAPDQVAWHVFVPPEPPTSIAGRAGGYAKAAKYAGPRARSRATC